MLQLRWASNNATGITRFGYVADNYPPTRHMSKNHGVVMRPAELEARVLEILDRVERGIPLEDSRDECKTTWPASDEKTARQLAGHANAARGDLILWMFGVDEKGRRVPGVSNSEFSNWYSSLRKHFEEAWAPDPELNINVPWKGVVVVAVLFETNRAPYVVKNPQPGQIQFEVPWREGNSTQTARRRDLLRLLVPMQKMPELELISASLDAWKRMEGQIGDWTIRFELALSLYILTRDSTRISIPGHRSTLSIDFVNPTVKVYHRKVGFSGSGDQLVVDAPTYFGCHCGLSTGDVVISEGSIANILLRLRLAELERDVDVKATLNWAPDRDEYRKQHPAYLGSWRYDR